MHTKTYRWMLTQQFYQSPKLESVQMPFNRWMVKQTMIHTEYRILLSNKKETKIIDIYNNFDKSPSNNFDELCWVKKDKAKMHTVQFLPQNDKIIQLKIKSVVAEARNRGGRGRR